MTKGTELITAERQRQIEAEGWTLEHDKAHSGDDLALAAVAYALPEHRATGRANFWPWDLSYWKPTPDDRIRELVKAGALIAAEIDRLLATEGSSGE